MTTTAATTSTYRTLVDCPDEVLGQIIQNLVKPNHIDYNGLENLDIRSLSLVSKSLVSECQRILFRAISMFSSTHWTGEMSIADTAIFNPVYTKYKWAELLKGSPHLATHVRTLYYHLPMGDVDREEEEMESVVSALEMMVNVDFLSLHADGYVPKRCGCDIPDYCGHQAYPMPLELFAYDHKNVAPKNAKALLGILQKEKLRWLMLKNVVIPGEVLEKCVGLTDLDLRSAAFANSAFKFGRKKQTQRANTTITPREVAAPRLLFLRGASASRIGWSLPDLASSSCISFDKVEHMSIDLDDFHPAGDHNRSIFAYTKNLTSLMLTVNTICQEIDMVAGRPSLKYLHPSALDSLTEIDLKLNVDMKFYMVLWIDHPYLGLFDNPAVVGRLGALRFLRVVVSIRGTEWHKMDWEPRYDGTWGTLDKVLGVRGEDGEYAAPNLGFLEVVIRFHKFEEWTRPYIVELENYAKRILKKSFKGVSERAMRLGEDVFLLRLRTEVEKMIVEGEAEGDGSVSASDSHGSEASEDDDVTEEEDDFSEDEDGGDQDPVDDDDEA